MDFAENSLKELPWGALDDVVMGGVSESTFQIDRTGGENGAPTGLFKGLCLSFPIAYQCCFVTIFEIILVETFNCFYF